MDIYLKVNESISGCVLFRITEITKVGKAQLEITVGTDKTIVKYINK